jgi:hypothetical protein
VESGEFRVEGEEGSVESRVTVRSQACRVQDGSGFTGGSAFKVQGSESTDGSGIRVESSESIGLYSELHHEP